MALVLVLEGGVARVVLVLVACRRGRIARQSSCFFLDPISMCVRLCA